MSRALAQELDALIQRLGPGTIAGFVAEPVVGSTNGAVPAVPGTSRQCETCATSTVCC